jgi:SH3-like domain-containing protein
MPAMSHVLENWKKVCDIKEDCGWIKSNLLSNRRYAMSYWFWRKFRSIRSKSFN